MATNDFLPFGLAFNSNVMSQADYIALAARTGGFTAGVAESLALNKVWRQSSFISAVLAQLAVDETGQSLLDNGDIAGAEKLFVTAFQTIVNSVLAGSNFATIPSLQAEITARAGADSSEAAARVSGDNGLSARLNQEITDRNTQDQAVVAYTNATFAALSQFKAVGSAYGYQKLPGGIIFQWGTGTTQFGYEGVAFPIAFPNAAFSIVINEANSQGWGNPINFFTSFGVTKATNASFNLSCAQMNQSGFIYGVGIAYNWFAVGV